MGRAHDIRKTRLSCLTQWLESHMAPAHLAGGYSVPKGQDVMISVYNIHHSPAVWDDPESFMPERFDLDAPPPTEQNTDYRYTAALGLEGRLRPLAPC